MANYGVQFNNSGKVTTALWSSGSGNFSVDIDFTTAATLGTDGLLGIADAGTATRYLAVFSAGKYQLRMNNINVYTSADGLIVPSTRYRIFVARTSGTSCNITLFNAAGGVIDTSSFSTADSFQFDRIGSAGSTPLDFNGIVWRVIVTGGTQARDYLSTVNTGTSWAEATNSQNGTLTGLSGTPWVLDPTATAALTGTATASITEADIVTGGKTIILTLTGDTFVAAGTGPIGSTADTQAIIDGLNSAQSETFGWNAEVRDKEVTTAVVRTSDTVATITLTASASYDISATETITATIPAVALTLAAPIVASPTFTVSATAGVPVITTEPLVNNTGTVLASTGSITADVYSLSDGSLVLRSTGLTTDASGILEISDAMLSSATEYKVVFQIGTDDGVARYTAV